MLLVTKRTLLTSDESAFPAPVDQRHEDSRAAVSVDAAAASRRFPPAAIDQAFVDGPGLGYRDPQGPWIEAGGLNLSL